MTRFALGNPGGNRGGRPDRMTKLREDLAKLGKDAKPPRDVMLELMVDSMRRYRAARQALAYLAGTGKTIKGKKAGNTKLFASALDRLIKAHDMALADAVAVAPYCHSKYASIAMQVDATTNYVIRAPAVASSPEEWLAAMAAAAGAEVLPAAAVEGREDLDAPAAVSGPPGGLQED